MDLLEYLIKNPGRALLYDKLGTNCEANSGCREMMKGSFVIQGGCSAGPREAAADRMDLRDNISKECL